MAELRGGVQLLCSRQLGQKVEQANRGAGRGGDPERGLPTGGGDASRSRADTSVRVCKMSHDVGAQQQGSSSSGKRSPLEVRTSLLFDCCSQGRVASVRKLLDSGGLSINGMDEIGVPLIGACREGRVECASLLLRGGADLETVDVGARATALYWAVIRGHTECAALCLSHGAVVRRFDACGNTPLHAACSCPDKVAALDCVRLLIEHRVEVCAMNAGGMTALYSACQVRRAASHSSLAPRARRSADRRNPLPSRALPPPRPGGLPPVPPTLPTASM